MKLKTNALILVYGQKLKDLTKDDFKNQKTQDFFNELVKHIKASSAEVAIEFVIFMKNHIDPSVYSILKAALVSGKDQLQVLAAREQEVAAQKPTYEANMEAALMKANEAYQAAQKPDQALHDIFRANLKVAVEKLKTGKKTSDDKVKDTWRGWARNVFLGLQSTELYVALGEVIDDEFPESFKLCPKVRSAQLKLYHATYIKIQTYLNQIVEAISPTNTTEASIRQACQQTLAIISVFIGEAEQSLHEMGMKADTKVKDEMYDLVDGMGISFVTANTDAKNPKAQIMKGFQEETKAPIRSQYTIDASAFRMKNVQQGYVAPDALKDALAKRQNSVVKTTAITPTATATQQPVVNQNPIFGQSMLRPSSSRASLSAVAVADPVPGVVDAPANTK